VSSSPSIALETCLLPCCPLTFPSCPSPQSTHGSRALASDYENEPPTGLSHHSVDPDHHHMPPLFADSRPESPPRRAKVSSFDLFSAALSLLTCALPNRVL
jgi:hypothetical protein